MGPVTTEDFVAFARGERVQVCDAFIESVPAIVGIRLFLPQPEMAPHSLDDLPPGDSMLSVLVRDHSPDLAAETIALSASRAADVAAAVAVMRVAWAWDDRAELPVRINGNLFVAAPRFDEARRWDVAVRAA